MFARTVSRPSLSSFHTIFKRIASPTYLRTAAMESQEHPPHHQRGHQRHYHVDPIRVHVKRSHKYKFNGTASYLYALRKYQFNPPYVPIQNFIDDRAEGKVFFNENTRLSVRKGHGKKEVGELPTSDIQNDSMYLCPVTIGEGPNAVTLNLDFDTGSSDLWGTP
jgi:hypothetical protein